MFNKILIANRGEIACRVIDTCCRKGVATVAVYSDADRRARHVTLADEAVHIGAAPVAESYLQGDRIIAVAQATGAQAIHPGYGFLSENPEFAEAVVAAGLVWIGPSADAIRAMGLKDAAKALMEKAGVPVVPGFHGADQDAARLAKEATRIGYPVLIKAVAGGGGKGMRLVATPEDFDAALQSARSEAETAFGNGDVLVEKFIENPRHIEVQVFGDTHGNAVHLFERDCSLQRRHQKVIEEAPAPGMTDAVRAAMGSAAVRAAQAIGYAGAGTVEFIVDGSGPLREDGFWFMEMNTRLQVEHPVTEEITGVDLVDWQLRVASGAPLPKAQEDLSINGWSFEARIYAEDVPAGFLPATGRLDHLRFPQGARVETGVVTGDDISRYYDPMIAKLVVHGPDRTTALRALERALSGIEVAGLVTNLDFLGALTRHEGFAAEQVDTGLIERDLEALTEETPLSPAVEACAVVALAGLDKTQPHQGFALWVPQVRPFDYLCGETARHALVRVTDGGVRVTLDGAEMFVQTDAGWSVDGRVLPIRVVRHGAQVSVFGAGSHQFAPMPLRRSEDGGGGDGLISAPMPGLIKDVSVAPGDTVTAGATLAVLEAMKMEHRLTADSDGQVAAVLASPGDQVEKGAALIRLEAAE